MTADVSRLPQTSARVRGEPRASAPPAADADAGSTTERQRAHCKQLRTDAAAMQTRAASMLEECRQMRAQLAAMMTAPAAE